ncbi:MAG TPA: EscN/YscN/HrcN family type III secretion system ATPase, partial [Pirellulales bacterium]|nr:EscN/YscN/HrcN family type III secretion system ATPase [Pirellulales bacterium]
MSSYSDLLDSILPTALEGRVARLTGLTAAVAGLPAPVGAVVEIERQQDRPLEAEVVGFRDDVTLVCPIGELHGVRRGNRVRLARTRAGLR